MLYTVFKHQTKKGYNLHVLKLVAFGVSLKANSSFGSQTRKYMLVSGYVLALTQWDLSYSV
jgi:hypothetical protein